MAQVQLQNVSKSYAGVDSPAVDDVSLEIKDREFVVLVGPSGCGKTTTLRLVAGLEELTAGEIKIGDRRVNDVAPADRDIAMIFQNYALYPHMTVYNNLGFPLKMRKTPRAEIDKRVREVAEKLGLTPYLNRKPKALSGGQRQRVAVGRAMVRNPSVFLFDEPLSNLDAKMRVSMRNEIRTLHRDLKATMIYVTHDQVEAMTMGDRIVVMNEGRVQQVDDPQTIYARPSNVFVAGFIGSPAMNLFRGSLVGEGDSLGFKCEVAEFPVPAARRSALSASGSDALVFGIRPEDISETAADDEASISIDAEVELCEPLGHEVVLHLKTNGTTFTARLPNSAGAEFGDKKTLHFHLAKAHFFDTASGNRIE